MASKRDLKRDLNKMVFDVVDECFSVQLYEAKKTEVTNKFIEDAADFLEAMLGKINAAKTKKDFAPIIEEIENKAEEWVDRLNSL
jgi:S-adenosylmethionine/arginine decarboxylase-like enzyme